jgi:hypothetical protein
MVSPGAGAVCPGAVVGLSPLGATLIYQQYTRRGQLILLQLVTPEDTSTWPMAAEVLETICLPEGMYQVSCTFLRPLTENQFEALAEDPDPQKPEIGQRERTAPPLTARILH